VERCRRPRAFRGRRAGCEAIRSTGRSPSRPAAASRSRMDRNVRSRGTETRGRQASQTPAASPARASTRTARMVTRSCASCRSGRARSSSNRAVATSVSFRPSARTASRRNTDLRVLDSTISSRTFGMASASGIAGDPPPLPTSSMHDVRGETYFAATTGSISKRSSASGEISDSLRPVRLIFVFQVARSR